MVDFRAKGGVPNFAAFSFLCCNLGTQKTGRTDDWTVPASACPCHVVLQLFFEKAKLMARNLPF